MKNPLKRNNNNKRDKDSNEEGKRWDKRDFNSLRGLSFISLFASVLVSLALRHSPGKSVKSLIRTANSFNFPLPRPITMPNQVGFSRHLSLSVRAGRKDGTNDSLMTARNLQRRKFLVLENEFLTPATGLERLFSNCRFLILRFAFNIGSQRRRKIAEPKPEWQREGMA